MLVKYFINSDVDKYFIWGVSYYLLNLIVLGNVIDILRIMVERFKRSDYL